MPRLARSRFSRLFPALALAGTLALGGCVGSSPYDDLMNTQPTGSAFSKALFQDYSYLARSFGISEAPSSTAFDANDAISVTSIDNSEAQVADAYAQKAMLAAKGQEPLPEAAPTDNHTAETMRLKLLRALDDGRTKAPEAAARAQVDYDCWVMNGAVDQLADASRHCEASFNQSLARLESRLNMASAPAPAPAPTSSPAPAATSESSNNANFTVYFALNSAHLNGRALDTIRQAIAAARAGRQSKITVVGHTDTSGVEAYNLPLSENRARAVKKAMVRLGARAEAVQISGTGEKDLAVQTANGVPNPKNRRAVITLIP